MGQYASYIIGIIRRYYLALAIIAIGLLSFAFSISNYAGDTISFGKFSFSTNDGVMSVYKQGSQTTLFALSPLDDYIYADVKEHIASSVNQTQVNPIPGWVQMAAGPFIPQQSLIWDVNVPSSLLLSNITYAITTSQDKINIQRTVKGSSLTEIGESLVYCYGCYVTDGQNIYFNTVEIDPSMIALTQQLHLTPVFVSTDQYLPTTESSLFVINAQGQKQYQLFIAKEDKIYLQERWHLLEIDHPLIGSTVQEVIKVF